MALSAVLVPTSLSAMVPANATIIINNVPYTPVNQMLNVNDRLLAPFREFGEAMGATVTWDGNTRRILTLFGNRYSIMHIDNSVVTYGTFTRNAQGEVQFAADSRTRTLDVAPRLVGNLTYIPIRAFGETVGVVVDWVPSTSTAFITAIPPTADENNNNETTPPNNNNNNNNNNRPANFGDFSNTSHFRIMSSSAVRSMHQDSNNNPFVFVLYDSSLESSKAIVPNIQDLAQELRFRVYGVDMANTNNRAADNNWLWQTFREAQFEDPTIYFVHGRNDVRQIQAPTDLDQLRDRLERFRTWTETGIEFGDFSNTTYFQNRTDSQIARFIDDGEEFILVLYDSTERDSAHYVPLIKAAAADREFRVYGLDVDRHPNFHRNISWLSDYRDYDDLPLMILVYSERNRMRTRQPESLERAIGYINEFIDNSDITTTASQFNDIPSGSVFRNYNIVTLRNRYYNTSNNNSFVIFIYDSSNANSRTMVEEFADAVNGMNMPSWISHVYAVNKRSNNFNQNHSQSNYNWLNMSNTNFNRNTPIMVYVPNGNISNASWHTPIATSALTASAFVVQLNSWIH